MFRLWLHGYMDHMVDIARSSRKAVRLNHPLTPWISFRYGVIFQLPCIYLIWSCRLWIMTCARNYIAFPMTLMCLNKADHHLFKEWRVACSVPGYHLNQCRIIVNYSEIWIHTTRCVRRSALRCCLQTVDHFCLCLSILKRILIYHVYYFYIKRTSMYHTVRYTEREA